MAGLSAGNGLSAGKELTPSTGLTLPSGSGLEFNGFGGSQPGPPGNNGILLESSTTSFLMLEDGTSYLLKEA